MDFKGENQPVDSLHAGEWRQLGSEATGMQTPIKRRPPPRPPSLPRRQTHPACLAEERELAIGIINATKGLVKNAFEDLRFGRKLKVSDMDSVVSAIASSLSQHPSVWPSVTRMKERHEYTYLHSVAVCGMMVGLARELGLDEKLTCQIGMAGLLFDVGKVLVPLKLLDKPGPLDLQEYATAQEHTRRGHELLCEAGIESEIVLDVCLHHHERPDGKGYPLGISTPTLSIHARMAAVCDVYDAITSRRSYGDRWSPGAALEWMGSTQGQFDPRVLRVFREMLGAFPIGSLVRLESQRLGVIIDELPDDPAYPDVFSFYCAESRRELPGERVHTRRDPIIGLEMASRWGFKDWEVRRTAMLHQFGSD